MPTAEHVELLVDVINGEPMREPVHAESLGLGQYRLLHSPGFVQGIAAGDEFRLIGTEGRFVVTRRSGNLAIQVFSTGPVLPAAEPLVASVSRLGGTLDGRIERGLVFTIPVRIGFAVIGKCFDDWVTGREGWEWYYGNVYSTVDGVTPLLWWNELGYR